MADPPILVPPKMAKQEDLHHHALEQLPNLAYCINDNPRWGEAIILGFQHYFTMLGTTVLIPSLVILNINGHSSDLARVVQSALFVSGINTLLQTVLGSRLPVVMGNSFYFLPITLSIVNAPRIIDIPDPHEVTDHPPLLVAHTPGTSDWRNSPFNLVFCGLSLSMSP
jgi:hypothetical protein